MTHEKFRIVAGGIVTRNGKVLIGKKEEGEEHPISGQWHFPGGHLDEGEEVREAVVREVKEETGLTSEVHQIVEVYRARDDMVRILFHCEAQRNEAEPRDELTDVKWVKPSELENKLGEFDCETLERTTVANFIEKLEKMPAF